MTDSATSDPILYHFVPSLAAATVFCALFSLSTILHFYLLLTTRAWYMIPLLLGGLCEAVGYAGRIIGSTESPDYSLVPYILQSILLLIAPALIAASIYMILGYIILAVDGERHSIIREKQLTKIFVIGDIFSFMIQAAGAGLLTKEEADAKDVGKYVIIGGLVIQLLFFGFFMIVTTVFYLRVQRCPTRRSKSVDIPWRKHSLMLFLASTMIMVRSLFRVIEYVQGSDGYLLRHELYLYIFDAALVLGTTTLFLAVHPSQITALLTGGKASHTLLRLEKLRKVTEMDEVEDWGSRNDGQVMTNNARSNCIA